MKMLLLDVGHEKEIFLKYTRASYLIKYYLQQHYILVDLA